MKYKIGDLVKYHSKYSSSLGVICETCLKFKGDERLGYKITWLYPPHFRISMDSYKGLPQFIFFDDEIFRA